MTITERLIQNLIIDNFPKDSMTRSLIYPDTYQHIKDAMKRIAWEAWKNSILEDCDVPMEEERLDFEKWYENQI